MMNYFTSDQHFYHEKIIELSKRGFKSLEHMHSTIITNWNMVVKPEDTVYILGDFCLKASQTNKLFKLLNGNKVLIKGNHDNKGILLAGFIEMLGKDFELVHNPDDSNYKRVIHGHHHQNIGVKMKRQKNGRLFINVNVELWNYTPVSTKQIDKLLRK